MTDHAHRTILGWIFIIVGVLLGLPAFIFGTGLVLFTIIATSNGTDATGLGFAFGAPIAVGGGIALLMLWHGVRIVELRRHGRIILAVLLVILSILYIQRVITTWS